MKDLIALQKKHDNEMRCAVLENKMNSAYRNRGFTFSMCGVLDDGQIMTNVYKSPLGSGIYLTKQDAGKILRELPKTKRNYDVSYLKGSTMIKWSHGEMNITIYVKHEDGEHFPIGTVYENDKVDEIIKNYTKNY